MTNTDPTRDALADALARRRAAYDALVPITDAPRRDLPRRNRRSINRRYGMGAKVK